MSKTEYQLKEVLNALDIPRERFREWLLRGYIKPSIQKAQGTRIINKYSLRDVYGIALFKHLIEKGHFPRNEAAKFVTEWFEQTIRIPVAALNLYNILIFLQDDTGTYFCQYFSIHGLGAEKGDSDVIRSQKNYLRLEAIRAQAMMETESIDWQNIFIVNFQKIKKSVDSRLFKAS